VASGSANQYQPSKIVTIYAYPSLKAFRSIRMPNGSQWWRQVRRTVSLTGHPNKDESPCCEIADGMWEKNNTAELDARDLFNSNTIDRHGCVSMDVNRDGCADMLCATGARKGDERGAHRAVLDPVGRIPFQNPSRPRF
jgi:hypothetical protein